MRELVRCPKVKPHLKVRKIEMNLKIQAKLASTHIRGGKSIEFPLDRIYCMAIDKNYFASFSTVYSLQSCKILQKQ